MTAVTTEPSTRTEPTPSATGPATAYLTAVAAALAGVAEPERQELLDDLADHLAELEAEDGEGLEGRLGPPELYAAELLASAGIDVGDALSPDRRPPWRQRATAAVRRQLEGPRSRAVREFLPELRSGWWVLRGWSLLALLTVWLSDDRRMFPVADVFGNVFVSTLALVAVVVASVQIGRNGARWPDRVATTFGVFGMLIALGQGSPDVDNDSDYGFDGSQQFMMMTSDGREITNIWPFDQDGQPLEGVFLFDQDGIPVEVGEGWAGDPGTVVVPGLFPRPSVVWEYDPVAGVERMSPATPPAVSIPRLPAATTTTTSGGDTTTLPPAEATTTAPVPAG